MPQVENGSSVLMLEYDPVEKNAFGFVVGLQEDEFGYISATCFLNTNGKHLVYTHHSARCAAFQPNNLPEKYRKTSVGTLTEFMKRYEKQ